MTNSITSSICPKCAGAGKLDWTDNDGGVCYKCEGRGYIGEMPAGFKKINKEAKAEAERMVKASILNLNSKGQRVCVTSYEFYPETIQKLIEMGKVFRYEYNKFWMSVEDMTLDFGGDSEYKYRLIVGGEFLVIKPVKIN